MSYKLVEVKSKKRAFNPRQFYSMNLHKLCSLYKEMKQNTGAFPLETFSLDWSFKSVPFPRRN